MEVESQYVPFFVFLDSFGVIISRFIHVSMVYFYC